MLSNHPAKNIYEFVKKPLMFRNNPGEIAILPTNNRAEFISLHQQPALFTIRV
jgi:hypothetical protein